MRKKVTLIVMAFAILSILSLKNIVGAENLNDLQNQKNELQEQIDEANQEISDLKIELTENLEQLNNLNLKITTYEQEVASLEENLSELATEVEEITDKLVVIEENYNIQREALIDRVVALYEAGDILYLDVLLNSNSVSEFVSNYFLIQEIVKYDNELLETIEIQKTQIETIKDTLTKRKETLDTLKANKEKTAISLENSKIIRNSYIAKLTEDEKVMQEKIDKYQAELNSIDSQITLLTSLNLGEDFVGGEFIWPAPGYTTITSNYGMRVHPIFKVNRMHTGTDIAMPTGSYIVASNDGVVIKSVYTSSYGNMVMIDHGGGITTLYAHGSEIVAQTGDTVKKGDLVMKAGSTGWSTGPHLHFEVRINGNTMDPMEFLSKQAEYLQEESQNEENSNKEDKTNGGKNS